MKIRTDFVSNSSSASFVINKEEHGCWFNQAFNILNKINNDWFEVIDIAFDDTIDYNMLVSSFALIDTAKQGKYYEKYFGVSIRRNAYINFKKYEKLVWMHTNDCSFINRIPNEYKDHILYLRVRLYDECDIGHASTEILYKLLKDTGLEFDWNR